MKKSEYTIARRNVWDQGQLLEGTVATLVNRDVAAAEAAGVVWDPEEEPLPDRIYFAEAGGESKFYILDKPGGTALCHVPAFWASILLPYRERALREAVRRYNLVPRMVAALMNRGGGRLDIEIIGEALRIAAGDK